jgi:hypothetical protein
VVPPAPAASRPTEPAVVPPAAAAERPTEPRNPHPAEPRDPQLAETRVRTAQPGRRDASRLTKQAAVVASGLVSFAARELMRRRRRQ